MGLPHRCVQPAVRSGGSELLAAQPELEQHSPDQLLVGLAGNTAWAAVSLYGASNWTIEGNSISHPATDPPQPYHPYCATGPAGGHSAGIFLCQDTDTNNLVTNNNKILNNSTSSYYGILSVGADEIKPYWAPRNNTFSGNNVFGSQIGCADDFKPGQWVTDQNVWTNNNCAGAANTPPSYF